MDVDDVYITQEHKGSRKVCVSDSGYNVFELANSHAGLGQPVVTFNVTSVGVQPVTQRLNPPVSSSKTE